MNKTTLSIKFKGIIEPWNWYNVSNFKVNSNSLSFKGVFIGGEESSNHKVDLSVVSIIQYELVGKK